jgi:hypothetical protein
VGLDKPREQRPRQLGPQLPLEPEASDRPPVLDDGHLSDELAVTLKAVERPLQTCE